jgi:aspartate racemase
MHIGLIGGIGPAATDFYYRRLISTFAKSKTPFDLSIAHADAPTLLSNLEKNNLNAQVEIYRNLTQRLAAAGADCVAVTSISGHFCINAFEEVSPLPVVNLIDEVNRAIISSGLRRIGILGTRTVMETHLYGAISAAAIIPPSGQDMDDVHEAYVSMAVSGVVTEAQHALFNMVSHKLINDSGAESIMLGGTDLALVFNEEVTQFRLVDCAAIHADAIARLAIP